MLRRPQPRSTGTRWALVGGALVGWTLIIGLASGDDATASTWLDVASLRIVLLAVLLAVAVAGVALIIFLNPFTTSFTKPERTRSKSWIGVAVLLVLVAWQRDAFWSLSQAADELAELETVGAGRAAAMNSEPPSTVADASLVLVTVLTIAAALAGFMWFRQRQRGPAPDDLAGDDDLDTAALFDAVESATQHVQAATTPRQAVMVAYATLEREFALHGSDRRPAETPTEHLTRAAERFGLSHAPLAEVGRLYELARFSHHRLGVHHVDRAHAALGQLGAELNPALRR